MDGQQFDTLAKAFAGRTSRRSVLGALVGLAAGGVGLAGRSGVTVAAKDCDAQCAQIKKDNARARCLEACATGAAQQAEAEAARTQREAIRNCPDGDLCTASDGSVACCDSANGFACIGGLCTQTPPECPAADQCMAADGTIDCCDSANGYSCIDGACALPPECPPTDLCTASDGSVDCCDSANGYTCIEGACALPPPECPDADLCAASDGSLHCCDSANGYTCIEGACQLPPECTPEGISCSAHEECCPGYFCREQNIGGTWCNFCVEEGDYCVIGGTNPNYYTCCSGLWCDGASLRCVPKPITCNCRLEACGSDADCCEGYFCTTDFRNGRSCNAPLGTNPPSCRYCGEDPFGFGDIYPPCQ